MKMLGQVGIKTILVPVISAIVSGVGTFTIAKGQVAERYESKQTDQQVVLDRLDKSDAQNRVDIITLRGEQTLIRQEMNGSVKRIEANVNELGDIIRTRLPKK